MNYTAVNTKIKAIKGKYFTVADYETLCRIESPVMQAAWLQERPGYKGMTSYTQALELDCARLTQYVYEKPLRNFVKSLAMGLAGGAMGVSYYLTLWRRLGALDKQHSGVMCRILGMEIDLHNILWIYRLKKYYGVSGDAVYGHLVPVSYKLNGNAMARLVNSKDVKGFVKEVSAGPYRDIFEGDFTEQSLARSILKKYRTESRKQPDSLVSICGHLYEKHLEIKNITAVMEGVRMGLSPVEILPRLY